MQLGETIYGNTAEDTFRDYVDITPNGMKIISGSPGWLANDDRPGYVRVISL
jgi:hypothetical protein